MEKAFIYLRVSTDDKGQDPTLQLADCQRLASERGVEVAQVFKEEASAWKNVDRPIFSSMVKRAMNGGITHIIVWDLDRLYRQRVEMVSFVKEMTRAKVKVISTRQKWIEELHKIPYPWNEIVFDLVINVIGWMAEEESRHKSERVKLAVTKKYGHTVSRAGKRWGRPELSKYLRSEIVKMRQDGKSIMAISKEKGLSKTTVKKYLRRGSEINPPSK
jgi:DNA invertase Pin-like site-specific DNA recombinase